MNKLVDLVAFEREGCQTFFEEKFEFTYFGNCYTRITDFCTSSE
jgi:hypothetical protein